MEYQTIIANPALHRITSPRLSLLSPGRHAPLPHAAPSPAAPKHTDNNNKI